MIRLFLSYYLDKNKDRQRELDECLFRNIENPLINEIHLLLEYPSDEELITDKKIITAHIKSRPSYSVFFDYINSINPAPNDISILANSDIYFDDTLSLLGKYSDKQVLALCRYDIKDNKAVFMNSWDSQDTWIFKGKIRQVPDSDFSLGKAGCDNAIANRLERAGYSVINPSRTIKTYHLHETQVHNYNPNDKIPQPYKLLTPTI